EYNKALYLQLARLHYESGNIPQAISFAKEAIALDYDYKEAILLLVQMYQQKDDYEAIVDLITTIKETNSEDGDYDWELAKAYEAFIVEEGLRDRAIQELSDYLKIEPEDLDTAEYLDRLSFSNDM